MSADRPLLVVGVDGATFDVMRPMVERGELPTFARLMREGAWGELRSVPNMLSPAAWTTFATGMNPGKHGIYHFVEFPEGSYAARYVKGADRRGRAIWRIAGDAGKRVAVINVPLTYPAEPVNGVMIAGLDAPGKDSPGFTHPPGLLADLEREIGEYIVQPGIGGYVFGGRPDLARDRAYETIERRTAAALALLRRERWDLFVVVFTQTDGLQHFFWRQMSPEHPDHARFGDAVPEGYRRVDRALARLLAAAPGSRVLVMSDHGFGFTKRGGFYLNQILEHLGLLAYRAGGGGGAVGGRARRAAIAAARSVYYGIHRRLGREAKLRLSRLFPALRERVESSFRIGEIDWSRTRAFSDRSRYEIWINLRGRQPQGTVDPADREATRRAVADALLRCRDPRTGERVVERVIPREELYHGPYLDRAPDLRVEFREIAVEAIELDGWVLRGRDVRMSPIERLRNGDHRLAGVVMLAGDGVRPGALAGAQLQDVAPTILYLLGLPVPAAMDGRVLAEALAPALVAARPVALDGRGGDDERRAVEFSDEDAAKVEDRLRSLGYIS